MKKQFFISSVLIILSFFLWYFYNFFKEAKKIEKLENKIFYVDIKQTKNFLKIKNPNKNVIIFLWEKKLQNKEEKILIK